MALIAVTLLAARRRGDARHQLLQWSSLMMLGAIKSSFAGPHVLVGAVMLLLLVLPEIRGTARNAAYILAWLLIGVGPVPAAAPVVLTIGLLQTLLVLAGSGWLLLRAPVDTARLERQPA